MLESQVMTGAYLEITAAGKSAQMTADMSSISVGRGPDNALVLVDLMASRQHCIIERTADGWRVRDLGSANGTFVNNQSVRDCLLSAGDHLIAGR